MGTLLDFFSKFKPSVPKPISPDPGVYERLRDLRRPAWIPQVEDSGSRRLASKFSGIPYLPAGSTWPACGHCKLPMQLFLQLHSDDLPQAADRPFGEGLLQMFCCTNPDMECEITCEAWAPFSKAHLLRILETEGEGVEIETSPVADAFPCKTIVSWKKVDDYPMTEECEDLGFDLSDAESEQMHRDEIPFIGEKLLGWPAWVQCVEYPDCPQCGEVMKLLFQIDSEHNLPYMFGDVGCGHITQCPTHPNVLAFGWACG